MKTGAHRRSAIPIIHGAHIHATRQVTDSLEDFIFITVSEALESWRVSLKDIDSIVTASSDMLDGRAISIMVTSGSVGGYLKDVVNLSSASEHAFLYQAAKVAAGRSRLGLVVSWGKRSESPVLTIDNLSQDPFFGRQVKLSRSSADAIATSAYLAQSRVGADDVIGILRKNETNAGRNPRSALHGSASHDAKLHIDGFVTCEYPDADACVAILVGDESRVRNDRPQVRLTGAGAVATPYWVDSDSLGAWPGLREAAKKAYRNAAITRPCEELDVVELCDLTPCHELMAYEELGFTDTAGAWFRSGASQPAGRLPVNPSGGIAGGDADFPNGLIRVAEIALQLRGEAGAVGVSKAKRGMAHAATGFPRQAHSVFVLEAGDA